MDSMSFVFMALRGLVGLSYSEVAPPANLVSADKGMPSITYNGSFAAPIDPLPLTLIDIFPPGEPEVCST